MSNLMAASNYTSTDQVVKNDIIYTTEKILGESLQHMENESHMSFKTVRHFNLYVHYTLFIIFMSFRTVRFCNFYLYFVMSNFIFLKSCDS